MELSVIIDQLLACSQDPRIAFCIPWPNALGGPTLAVAWYAIIMVAAIIIGSALAMKHFQREGGDPNHVLDGLTYALPAAVIGARVMFIVLEVLGGDADISSLRLLQIINIRSGGLNFFGVLLFGALAILIYARVKKLTHLLMLGLDCATLGIWLAQGLGRYNNLINRELYGPPTGSGWFGMLVPPEYRLAAWSDLTLYPPDTRFHPTMVYESVWLLVTFAIVYVLMRRYRPYFVHGVLSGAYLLCAGLGRFIMETWRPDQARIPDIDISFSRVLALIEFLVGVVWLLDRAGKIRLPFLPPPQTVEERRRLLAQATPNRDPNDV